MDAQEFVQGALSVGMNESLSVFSGARATPGKIEKKAQLDSISVFSTSHSGVCNRLNPSLWVKVATYITAVGDDFRFRFVWRC